MKRLFIAILGIISLNSAAQMRCGQAYDVQNLAFQHGEQLSYNVDYSASVFSTSVADVTFRVDAEANAYKISAVGKTRPFYSTFFEMEDQYQSWLDKTTLRPIRMMSKIREGGYQFRATYDYNWQNSTVRTFGQNIKSGFTSNKTMKLGPCSYDAVALFFNLRNVDLASMRQGVRYKLDLVLDDTIRTIQYRIMAREEKELSDVGMFKTVKIGCTIATSQGDALKDGSEFFIWLSDDKNRIPIYMESPIRVGSIKVYLNSWKNLKHPFTAKLSN